MITATMTKHAIHDRAERLAFIAEYVGVGTIQYRFPSEQSDYAEYCITSTGVLIVRNIDSNSIITAYCPNMNKAVAIFRKNGWTDVPYTLKEKIDKNYKVAKKMGFI
jgi:hypothetical protein